VKLPFDQYTLAPLFRKIQKDLANIADITSNEFDGAGISLVWRLTDPLLSRAVTGPGPPHVDADGPGPLSCNPLKNQCISRRGNIFAFPNPDTQFSFLGSPFLVRSVSHNIYGTRKWIMNLACKG
jgi:hypothetical protein